MAFSASASASASSDRHLRLNKGTGLAGVVVVIGLSVSPAELGRPVLFMTLAIFVLDAAVAVLTTRVVLLTGRIHPTDLVVGDRFCLELSAHSASLRLSGARRRPFGRAMPLVLGLPSEHEPVSVVVEPPGSGSMETTALTRRVICRMRMTATSSGLCGLVSCIRTHNVPLPRPVEVGPRSVEPSLPFPDLGGGWGEGTPTAARDGDLVRGLRSYLPGDRPRQVHWRASARHGELVVKEAEEPQSPVIHVVLDLGAGGEAGELAAGRTAWYAGEALRRGYQVTLTTVEGGHFVTASITSQLLVNRRLARATPGAAARPETVPWGVRVLVVSDEGDSWP